MNEEHEFVDLGERLDKVSDVSSLLDIIFDDYLIQYYQDPPPGRKEYLEKVMNEIHLKIKGLKQ